MLDAITNLLREEREEEEEEEFAADDDNNHHINTNMNGQEGVRIVEGEEEGRNGNEEDDAYAVFNVDAEGEYAWALEFRREEAFRRSSHRHQAGTSILCIIGTSLFTISVFINVCSFLLFLASLLSPVFSYVNVENGTRMYVFLAGYGSSQVHSQGDDVDKHPDCLKSVFDFVRLSLGITLLLLFVALVLSFFACRWSSGGMRFVRPFFLIGASIGGFFSCWLGRRGYTDACNGAFRWYRPEVGVYCMIIGAILTTLLTLVLFAQVSRYPIILRRWGRRGQEDGNEEGEGDEGEHVQLSNTIRAEVEMQEVLDDEPEAAQQGEATIEEAPQPVTGHSSSSRDREQVVEE